MPRFRKKPVVIEAIRYTGGNLAEITLFCPKAEYGKVGNETELMIPTWEGELLASIGDWIIKGIRGEFYPCKPGVFDATYELVEGE